MRVYVVLINHVMVKVHPSLKEICRIYGWNYHTLSRKPFIEGKTIFVKNHEIVEIYKTERKTHRSLACGM